MVILRCECVYCLCNYCTKNKCRYIKANKHDVCCVRCVHVEKSVYYNYQPVLICDKFQHAILHKRYKIKLIRSARQNALATISLKDFLKLLGGDDKC